MRAQIAQSKRTTRHSLATPKATEANVLVVNPGGSEDTVSEEDWNVIEDDVALVESRYTSTETTLTVPDIAGSSTR